jgi:phage tail-like protein
MNVNGARFHLLLGRDDWGRCVDRDDEGARPLASWWAAQASPSLVSAAGLPAWDEQRQEVTLQPGPIELPATAGEPALTLDARRGAAADRNGNVYRVADDRHALRVTSAGSGNETAFWPALPDDCAPTRAQERLAFEPATTAAPPPVETYLALAVTADDYLVVAFARRAIRGFLSFDLLAGGPPVETTWPSAVPIEPFDMCARHGGGVWLLDRAHRHLWELDCTLAVVRTGQPALILESAQPGDFQPLSGPAHSRPPAPFPGGLDLAAHPVSAIDPIAVDSTGAGTVLLLDRDAGASRSRVVRLRRDGDVWKTNASNWLGGLPAVAHDLVYGAARRYQHEAADKQVFIATAFGNQAHAFVMTDAPDRFELRAAAELFPLRRYAGRALIVVQGGVRYDSGLGQPVWTPIVQQPRARFAPVGEVVTPVFDSGELGTTWDKLLLDACLPADTALEIESRAGDERSDLVDGAASPAGVSQVIAQWSEEPAPQLRNTGPELPWLRREAARATRREAGSGTWELLLQNAHGRFLQLRLRLRSYNGTGTPRLRALRVWSPRFAYPQRFLPAVYREDRHGGAFLERWLANFESTLTHIEDKVATVQALFDARTAPTEALGWLGAWFELALDPAWDERRNRLFVQRAIDFFRWRGTVHGLRLGLELAFDPCFDAAMFDGPRATDDGPRRIRIVEAYQTRTIGALAAGDPAAAGSEGPRVLQRQLFWTPDEGNAGLADRYAKSLGREATPVEQITPFSLVPPLDATEQQGWRSFFESAVGFVPAAGALERRRWQAFLTARYVGIEQLNAKHGSAYADFNAVALPHDEPANTAAAADWRAFCERVDVGGTRTRWQDFLARRYRRIERLRRAHGTSWADFVVVALPDVLPGTSAPQTDWLQFERQLLAMHRTAHRFSVLLPLASVTADPFQLEDRLGLARRLIDLEKPAHTVFDVRFFWAFNRVGEARLGLDTQLGAGSRAPELIPDAVVGRAYIGASFVSGPTRPRSGDRLLIDC